MSSAAKPAARQAKAYVYDTTLRDGAQHEGVSLSLQDKLHIAQKLDEFKIDYIEGGYPLSNPKDAAFFPEAARLKLKHAKIAAFGSTRRKKTSCEDDIGLKALLDAETPVCTIVGKAWDMHVNIVLKTSLVENLRMIAESIEYLKKHGREVIFDAEHFFDGYAANADYGVRIVMTAQEAGADAVVLCDTNGGTIPSEIARVVAEVSEQSQVLLGIHAHNDSGLAVASSVAGVEAGAPHVQGTVNGFGERCGNADLCTIMPILSLKMKRSFSAAKNLRHLTDLSRYVYEMANMIPSEDQPFVGGSAFAHKGGLHIDAIRKDPRTYEHIEPKTVGNERRLLISELCGHSLIMEKAEKFEVQHDKELMRKLRKDMTELEARGYQFESAEASFELLIKKEIGHYRKVFDVEGYHVSVLKSNGDRLVTDATVKLRLPNGERVHTASEGDGPVNALDGALRKALEPYYPSLKSMNLVDYRVRVINAKEATAASVRVIIQSHDDDDTWGTVGVDENVIEASWKALVESIEYKLLKDHDGK